MDGPDDGSSDRRCGHHDGGAAGGGRHPARDQGTYIWHASICLYTHNTTRHTSVYVSPPNTLPIILHRPPKWEKTGIQQEFFATARRLCDETGALLIVDEVQTGVGRTGTLWGYENTGE